MAVPIPCWLKRKVIQVFIRRFLANTLFQESWWFTKGFSHKVSQLAFSEWYASIH